MIAFIIITLVIIAAFLTIKKRRDKLKEAGYDLKNIAKSGSLVGGHPDINAQVKSVELLANAENIAICDNGLVLKGYINKASITDVKFEDATTFEKRISAGRLLLVGVFALAWKKKSKNENAYMVIEWADGRFNHSTSFLFVGAGSTQQANTARNWLIKELR